MMKEQTDVPFFDGQSFCCCFASTIDLVLVLVARSFLDVLKAWHAFESESEKHYHRLVEKV